MKSFKSMKTFKQSYDYIYDKIDPVILEEKILKLKLAQWFTRSFFWMYFCNFFILFSPFGKRCGPSIWTNLNPLHPRRHFTNVWLKLAQSSFFFLNFCNFNAFSILHSYLPLEKGQGPSFEQIWIPFIQGCFVPSLVHIGSNWPGGSGGEGFL